MPRTGASTQNTTARTTLCWRLNRNRLSPAAPVGGFCAKAPGLLAAPRRAGEPERMILTGRLGKAYCGFRSLGPSVSCVTDLRAGARASALTAPGLAASLACPVQPEEDRVHGLSRRRAGAVWR